MHKGLLITFEGGEGAGKSTLIEKVYTFLKERFANVIKTRAPGGTEFGQTLRNLLLSKEKLSLDERAELFLFLADRAQHVKEVIFPALANNAFVLCDRFHDSTIAYQGAARGFGEEFVENLCLFSSQNLQSDLTLYLDLDPTFGLERVQKSRSGTDRMEEQHVDFHQKVREGFQKIAKADLKRFRIIDARQSPEMVFQQAIKLIDELL